MNVEGPFEAYLVDGSTLTCGSLEDARLVIDAYERFYEGNSGRKLPKCTLAALERAGQNGANSMLYRSVLHNLQE
jgi:hypothetical protein